MQKNFTIQKNRKYENTTVAAFIVCSLIFNYVSLTKTWDYPIYLIKATETFTHNWKISLVSAFLMSLLAMFLLRMTERISMKERQFTRLGERLLHLQSKFFSYVLIVFKRISISVTIFLMVSVVFCFFRDYKFIGFIYLPLRG